MINNSIDKIELANFKLYFTSQFCQECYSNGIFSALSWKTDEVITVGFNDGILECNTTHLTAFSAVMVSKVDLVPFNGLRKKFYRTSK